MSVYKCVCTNVQMCLCVCNSVVLNVGLLDGEGGIDWPEMTGGMAADALWHV